MERCALMVGCMRRCLFESVEERDDPGDFRVRQSLMAGNGELLGVDLLGDGQLKLVPRWIAVLAVRRDGIVNRGLHTIVCKVLLQWVAMFAEDGEDMPD